MMNNDMITLDIEQLVLNDVLPNADQELRDLISEEFNNLLQQSYTTMEECMQALQSADIAKLQNLNFITSSQTSSAIAAMQIAEFIFNALFG